MSRAACEPDVEHSWENQLCLCLAFVCPESSFLASLSSLPLPAGQPLPPEVLMSSVWELPSLAGAREPPGSQMALPISDLICGVRLVVTLPVGNHISLLCNTWLSSPHTSWKPVFWELVSCASGMESEQTVLPGLHGQGWEDRAGTGWDPLGLQLSVQMTSTA